MMPSILMTVMMDMAAVGAPLRLKGVLHLAKIRSKAMEHLLNHVVGANEKRVIPDFGGQVAISQMPGKAHQLIRIFMPDLDN